MQDKNSNCDPELGSPLFEDARNRYLQVLSPLFLPSNPIKHDIIRYFASLLRVVGIEDKGWDPYAESRTVLNDLNALMALPLPADRFDDGLTIWRLGLMSYNHTIEMAAPYEVLANFLRFRLEEGYSPNPFYRYLSEKQRKGFKRSGLFPRQKIAILETLGERANIPLAQIFSEFVNFDLRNAMAHSDFIISDNVFRCRNGYAGSSFSIPFEELDFILTNAKAFISAFFILEQEARRCWGGSAGRAIPYDPHYKGMMEVLADRDGLMNGFKVHWPNSEESFYRRTEEGIDMVNCLLDMNRETIQLWVGMYARQPGQFSLLVEDSSEPRYTPVEGTDDPPVWDPSAAQADPSTVNLPPIVITPWREALKTRDVDRS